MPSLMTQILVALGITSLELIARNLPSLMEWLQRVVSDLSAKLASLFKAVPAQA